MPEQTRQLAAIMFTDLSAGVTISIGTKVLMSFCGSILKPNHHV
ncbi:MAG: hypothetical protein O7F74_02820 [Bacteroidetes bacterium]|nr:hypothetical protein [Bacteroidota bacterium]